MNHLMKAWIPLFAVGGIGMASGCSSGTEEEPVVAETSQALKVGGRLGFEVWSEDSTNVSSGTKGAVMCPTNEYAIGGGANCTDGEFSVSYPIVANDSFGNIVPVGWQHWHRGTATGCKVYAVCAPKAWFEPGDIEVTWNQSGQNPNTVSCVASFGDDWYAIGGGSRCSDGDFDVAYPDNGADWNDWHRGATSGDCTAYAVCVNKSNFVAAATYVSPPSPPGYGNASVTCPGATAVSGGAYCSDGDVDYNYPFTNLTGWSEHHRGASSNDCQVFANCVPDSMYNLVQPGNPCSATATRDCSNKCVANTTVMNAENNFSCDKSSTVNLNCAAFKYDNGFCVH